MDNSFFVLLRFGSQHLTAEVAKGGLAGSGRRTAELKTPFVSTPLPRPGQSARGALKIVEPYPPGLPEPRQHGPSPLSLVMFVSKHGCTEAGGRGRTRSAAMAVLLSSDLAVAPTKGLNRLL